MKSMKLKLLLGAAIPALVCSLLAGPVLAQPPGPHGGRGDEHRMHSGHGPKGERSHSGYRDPRAAPPRDMRREEARRAPPPPRPALFRFSDAHRRQVHDYYAVRYHDGRCPPGLIKRGKRCEPPGQARAWSRGRPLPPKVVYYDVPRRVVEVLPPPPPHHRYVRVAADILLIAIGTGIVIDAIEDLGRF